jgi:hypothetical protein
MVNYQKKALIINDNEHVFILSKVIKSNDLLESNENKEYYNELLDIKKNPYINFNSYGNNNGFNYNFDDMITSIRYTNIEFNKQSTKYKLEIRNIGNNVNANIIGFIITPLQLDNNINYINYTNKDLKKINKKNDDEKIIKYFYKKKEKENNLYYKLFSKNIEDESKKKDIEIENINSDKLFIYNENIIKSEFIKIHNIIENDIYNKIIKYLINKNYNLLSSYFVKNSINLSIDKLLDTLHLKKNIINMELTNIDLISSINKQILNILSDKKNKLNNKLNKNNKLKKLPVIKENKNNKKFVLKINKFLDKKSQHISIENSILNN